MAFSVISAGKIMYRIDKDRRKEVVFHLGDGNILH